MELSNVSLNRLVPIFLMSSYLYYEQDKSVLDDTQFDYLCKKLYSNWDKVEHMHKHIITKADLAVGSGYGIQYTNMIIGGAMSWYKQETMSSVTTQQGE
jgi:NAD-dependent DNA ligase